MHNVGTLQYLQSLRGGFEKPFKRLVQGITRMAAFDAGTAKCQSSARSYRQGKGFKVTFLHTDLRDKYGLPDLTQVELFLGLILPLQREFKRPVSAPPALREGLYDHVVRLVVSFQVSPNGRRLGFKVCLRCLRYICRY